MFVGDGSYGCVFRPAKPCKNSLKTKTVAKVFRRYKDYKEELKLNALVKKIDPKGVFTLHVIDDCPIMKSKYDLDQLRRCTSSLNDNNRLEKEHNKYDKFFPMFENYDFYQIIYPDGGMDLDRAIRSHTFDELFKNMWRIFYGIVQLDENEFCHLDIKTINMVYEPNTEKISLIDFGLSKPYDEIYNERNIYNISHLAQSYYYFAPEIFYYNMYLKDRDRFIKKYLSTKKVHKLGLRNYIFVIETIIESVVPYIYEYKRLTNLFKDIVFVDYRRFYKNLDFKHMDRDVKKIDVYSLGVAILEMLGKALRIKQLVISNDNIERIESIVNLIKKMIAFDVSQRISAIEAYEIYKDLF
jgi:serine/threonine protein kinase